MIITENMSDKDSESCNLTITGHNNGLVSKNDFHDHYSVEKDHDHPINSRKFSSIHKGKIIPLNLAVYERNDVRKENINVQIDSEKLKDSQNSYTPCLEEVRTAKKDPRISLHSIIIMIVLAVLLTFILFGLAIYFMIFNEHENVGYSTEHPSISDFTNIFTISTSTNTNSSLDLTRTNPITSTIHVSTIHLTTKTTTEKQTTVPSCLDNEPEFCPIILQESLCSTPYGQSQCCQTCKTPSNCVDMHVNCFKVRLYDLCLERSMKFVCCATCT